MKNKSRTAWAISDMCGYDSVVFTKKEDAEKYCQFFDTVDPNLFATPKEIQIYESFEDCEPDLNKYVLAVQATIKLSTGSVETYGPFMQHLSSIEYQNENSSAITFIEDMKRLFPYHDKDRWLESYISFISTESQLDAVEKVKEKRIEILEAIKNLMWSPNQNWNFKLSVKESH